MDIAGAKALKERLGEKGTAEDTPASSADVPEGAPPVYQWTGVKQATPDEPAADDKKSTGRRPMVVRLLTLSFR